MVIVVGMPLGLLRCKTPQTADVPVSMMIRAFCRMQNTHVSHRRTTYNIQDSMLDLITRRLTADVLLLAAGTPYFDVNYLVF